MHGVEASSLTARPAFGDLEKHRRELTGYCYRMLGSPFEAEDAVQETMVRAWRNLDRFEGRSALALVAVPHRHERVPRHAQRPRAPRAADGPGSRRLGRRRRSAALPEIDVARADPRQPGRADDADPAEPAGSRESIRLAFVAALSTCRRSQRAVLILREVLRWKAAEVAELLDTSVASVNSALQRARATLGRRISPTDPVPARPTPAGAAGPLRRGLRALRHGRADVAVHEDATLSMPPYALWLRGHDDILGWWVGPGTACRGSRVLPTMSANGTPRSGSTGRARPAGHDPWALQVLEIEHGRIAEFNFFLDTEPVPPVGPPAAARVLRRAGVHWRKPSSSRI